MEKGLAQVQGANLNFLQGDDGGGTPANPPGFGLRQSSGALDVIKPARERCFAICKPTHRLLRLLQKTEMRPSYTSPARLLFPDQGWLGTSEKFRYPMNISS
jgi:hypothetical protein